MKKVFLAAAAVVLLAGCNATTVKPTDPCTRLPKPTASEQAAALGGAEVEREVNKIECVVRGGRWVQDR